VSTQAAEAEVESVTAQHHFEIEVDHDNSTASLVKHSQLEMPNAIASMTLDQATNAAIVHLFKSIDVNGDGELTQEDFDKLAGDLDSDFGAEGWAKLQEHFDVDADGRVSLDEFRFGLKGFGIKVCLESQIGFSAPYDWTVAQWCNEVSSVFSKSVSYETSLLSGWYQQFDGIKSAMRGKSTETERNTDPTLLVVYLNSDSEGQLKRLYELMDKDGNGKLEASDFAIMSKNPQTAQFWEELKVNFDQDGDDAITLEEFKLRVMDTVRTRIEVGSIPSAAWTWRQVIARLGEWCNWMVQEQCREIFSYLAYGEYGSANDDAQDSESFGCGSSLGAPAFPGGEPPSNNYVAYEHGLSAEFAAAGGSGLAPVAAAFDNSIHSAPTQAPVAPMPQAPANFSYNNPTPAPLAPALAPQQHTVSAGVAGITIHVHGPVHIHMSQ